MKTFMWILLLLFLSCFPAEAETITPPRNPKYWKYQSWYLDHAVVDLVVSGKDPRALEKSLAEVSNLASKGVGIRRIAVLGGNAFTQLDSASAEKTDKQSLLRRISHDLESRGRTIGPEELLLVEKSAGLLPSLREIATRLGLHRIGPVSEPGALLEKLQISYSPAWVVTYHGKRFIYEGTPTVSNLFDQMGRFIGESNREAAISTPTLTDGSFHDKQHPSPLLGIEFNIRENGLKPGSGTYDVKPRCKTSQIREEPVFYDSEHLSAYDLLFYDYQQKSEQNRALSSRLTTVPYLPGDLKNPYREAHGIQQELGRFLDVRCLPTRVRYVYRQGKRIEEYREGEKAWEP